MSKLSSNRFNLLFIFVVTVVTLNFKLGAVHSLHGCDPDDADFKTCLKNLLQELLLQTPQGFPEYGLPTFDPLSPPIWKLTHKGLPNDIELDLFDTQHIGLSTSDIQSIEADLESYQFSVAFYVTKYLIKGNYTADGLFSPGREKSRNVFKGKYNEQQPPIPIKGEGDVTIAFYELMAKWLATGTTYEKDGEKYLNLVFDVEIAPGIIHSQYNNLHNETTELGENTNQNINCHWKDFYEPLYKNMCEHYATGLTDAVNHALSQIPLNKIFPKSK